MTTDVLATPSQQRRDRIRRLEELVANASRELVGLYQLEGYRPRHRTATRGVATTLAARSTASDNLRAVIAERERLSALAPAQAVNAWAIREGHRAPGTRGSVPKWLRAQFIIAGHPGWTPPTEDAP